MGRKFLTYSFLAIGGYLALAYATGFGSILMNASTAAQGYAKVLQGRG